MSGNKRKVIIFCVLFSILCSMVPWSHAGNVLATSNKSTIFLEEPDYNTYFPLIMNNYVETIIPETTEVLTDESLQYLSDVTDGTFTFTGFTQELGDVGVGDVIVGGLSSQTEEGFLRKVTNITESSSGYIIETTSATLEDTIYQGYINFYQELTPDMVTNVDSLEGVSLDLSQNNDRDAHFNIPLDNVILYDKDGNSQTTDDQVIAFGDLSFNLGIEFSAPIIGGEANDIQFLVRSDVISDINITSHVSLDYEYFKAPIKLASLPMKPIRWLIPGTIIPIVFTPEIGVFIGLDGSIGLGAITTGVSDHYTLHAGVKISDGVPYPIKTHTNELNFITPSFELDPNVEVKLYLGSEVSLKLYGVVGPKAGIKGYLRAEAVDEFPGAKLYGGLEVFIGLDLKIVKKVYVDFQSNVIEYEKLLWPTNTPGAFNKSSPSTGSTGVSTSPTLSWGTSTGATSYDYCYDTTNDNTCSNWTSNGTSTSKALSGLNAETTYYWHVRAVNTGGTTYSNESSTAFWSFTTVSTSSPGAFNKSSPSNGSTGVSTSPTLSWGTSTGATLYNYCYDTTNDNACSTWYYGGTGTSIALSGLKAGTTYYWHVRAINTSGITYSNGSSTAFWSFTTGGGTVTPGEMVLVPAGEFKMGCHPDHNSGYSCESDELPLHTVYLDAYYIDKTEVTQAQYDLCVENGVCSKYYQQYGNPNFPIWGIPWDGAKTYCTWAGKRLPTEAEWEKAARGSSLKTYPWGDGDPNCSLANYYGCVGGFSEVGSYPLGASQYGALDMAGNAYEWVNDYYSSGYYSISPYNNPTGPTGGLGKVIRGGNWYNGWHTLKTSHRNGPFYYDQGWYIGFRCASSSP